MDTSASFDDTLTHEFAPFLQFCRAQHSEESLLFWNAIEAYRKRAAILEGNVLLVAVEIKPTIKRQTFIDMMKQKQKQMANMLFVEVSQEERVSMRHKFLAQADTYNSARDLDFDSNQFRMLQHHGNINDAAGDEEAENQHQMYEMARQLYFTFLDETTSKQWICLPAECTAGVKQELSTGSASRNMFDEAQRHVFADMKQIIFPQYLEDKKVKLFPEYFK